MTIKDRVNEDLKTAMKARDAKSLEAIRLIRAEILIKEKEGTGTDIDDGVMIEILQKMVRKRKDAVEQFRAGNREDLAQKDEGQIEVIERYLPAEIDVETIRAAARKTIEETGATSPKDLGKIMGVVMKELKASGARVEGTKVREIAAELLSQAGKQGETG